MLTGFLFIPQIHVLSLYSTPELALVIGNVFSYLVSPKWRVVLSLKKKTRLAPDILDFVFTPSHRLAFVPGQYIECTLEHPHPDSRGNRRYFTLASSPTEDAMHLGVRFYPRGSSFKRALAAMSNRASLAAGQVAGDFTMPADPQAASWPSSPAASASRRIAACSSICVDTKQRRDIALLYANRVAGEIVYRDVLAEAQAALGARVAYTLTDTSALPKDWTGHTGRITERMISVGDPRLSRAHLLHLRAARYGARDGAGAASLGRAARAHQDRLLPGASVMAVGCSQPPGVSSGASRGLAGCADATGRF